MWIVYFLKRTTHIFLFSKIEKTKRTITFYLQIVLDGELLGACNTYTYEDLTFNNSLYTYLFY